MARFLRTRGQMPSAIGFAPGMSPPERVPPEPRVELRAANASKGGTTVAAVKTPITPAQASGLIAGALEEVTGEKPSKECVAVLTAQWAHETGRGASMYNYNFAGIKGTGPSGLSVSQRTREGWGESERTITDNFRAYRTAEEGALDYVKLLAKRFPEALGKAREGDAAGCVQALKQRGYFTGNEVAYTRSVVRIARELLPDSLEFSADPLPVLTADPVERFAIAERDSGYRGHDPFSAPFVNAAALGDEVSRAALRILSNSREDRDRNDSTT